MAAAGDNRLPGEFSAMHKEQQRDGGGGQMFKEGDESATGREE